MAKEKVELTGRTTHAKGTTKHAGSKAPPGAKTGMEKAQDKDRPRGDTKH
jgi:hypothetical protein